MSINHTGLKKVLQGMMDKKENVNESLVPVIQSALEAIEAVEQEKIKEIVGIAADVNSSAAATMVADGVSGEAAVNYAIANSVVMAAFYLAGMKAGQPAVSQA